jgi:hypothetical protein
MSSVNLFTKIAVELEIRARIEVLHDTVKDLAKGFMGGSLSSSTEETIRKGIIENQYLESVTVYYLLSDGKMVGQAEITIDWKKYEANIKTDGTNINLEKGKSLMEQISQLYPIFIQHMEKMSKAFGVTSRMVRYSYRNEIYFDKEKLAKARATLGTSPSEPIEWSEKGERDPDKSNVLGLSTKSGVLSELGVNIQSLRKLKK